MKIKPIEANARIIYLDILRGMAILFIFLANIYTFSGWGYMSDEAKIQFSMPLLNSIINQLTVVFIDGKWYSIFSLLFGIGFVIQYENTNSRNKSFNTFFIKRMFGLLFFGLIHLFFLWSGDILALYALVGFLLVLFKNQTNRSLLIWASILLFLPLIHQLLMIAFNNFYPEVLYEMEEDYFANHNILIEDNNVNFDYSAFIRIWLNGTSWKQFSVIAFGMPLERFAGLLYDGRFFKVLACFLIGIWAGRKIIHDKLLKNTTLLKKIFLYGFLIGIPLNILLAYGKVQSQQFWQFINIIVYALGVVPLACGYSAAVALMMKSGHKNLSYFAPVGQMAMSNYIFQTIISITVFYGIGFGFAFDLSLWIIILIALFIFLMQIIFSTIWLKYFRFGPLEWLWRMMTYQKYINNRKT